MKKILSVVLVLSMVLALGVTAFAANPAEIEVGKTVGFEFAGVTKTEGAKVTDTNGILVFGDVVVVEKDNRIVVNVTAPAGTAGKITKIEVKSADGKTTYASAVVEVKGAAVVTPVLPGTLDAANLTAALTVDATNVATVNMGGLTGITAEVYNTLKNANYEKIVFANGDYTWTLTRGDYTKMNVTAPIYFGVTVDNKLYKTENGTTKEDTATENAVLKALGNTKADVFYVTVDTNCNIANVANKPELVVNVDDTWIKYNNKFSVTAYKFDGEKVTEAAKGLAIKPATGKLALNLTTAGVYVFVGDNTTVAPSTPSTEKPNAGTGANNAAAAVVALAVMAVAAVASKKVVK